MITEPDRRPLKTRAAGWAKALASALVRTRVSPNAISVGSLVFASLGAWLLAEHADRPLALVGVAACIQLRLVCNMLDGMVAIEGGRQSPTGALFNEIPDRVADSLLLVALGYAIDVPWLGWFAALAAALTAYIRVLGGSLGLPQDFRGPQAKPHRMFVLTLACLISASGIGAESARTLAVSAWVIAIGAALTCVLRALAIGRALEQRSRS